MFTNGKCFWFAKILNEAYPGGEIVYDAWVGHFYYQYEGLLYDIYGSHPTVGRFADLTSWEDIQFEDSAWAKRIKRDCIFFGEE